MGVKQELVQRIQKVLEWNRMPSEGRWKVWEVSRRLGPRITEGVGGQQ